MGFVCPGGGRGDELVKDLQHVVVATKLMVASWVCGVGFLVGYLVEHGLEEHVDAGVAFNHGFELLEHRVKFCGVF